MLCLDFGCSNYNEIFFKTTPEKQNFFLHFLKDKSLLNNLENGVIFVKEKISFPVNQPSYVQNILPKIILIRLCQRLMPNSEVLIRLNPGIFPTIYVQHSSSQMSNYLKRSSRKIRSKIENIVAVRTSTPKKWLL